MVPVGLPAQGVPAVTEVVVGPNVNMVGGPASFVPPSTLIGDPFLQRQNEPSMAVSSRNPCHLVAGANDYRAVDLEEAAGEIGDAWLGLFKSLDCGASWTSTLLPGHKLDVTPEGLASPIKGLAAAADPTVRAGTDGMFYYSGIAFNRGDGEIGKVFVARLLDRNNKDGGDPIAYLGATEIARGTAGQFLDKPWIATDIARGNSTCTIDGRQVPAGPVYLTYTTFLGSGNNVRTAVMFTRSLDCGVTWSNPAKLSERFARNQGTAIAVDPGTGHVHIVWREFTRPDDPSSVHAILAVRSTDGGQTFTKATRIDPGFVPFDQASSALTFRTNAYPTIAVVPAEAEGRPAGQAGRVYVAWAARGFGTERVSDARIVISTSTNGTDWSPPRATDQYPDAGHQIMPALAFSGGKLALAYYDLRDDASGGFDDLVIEYGQRAYEECVASQGALGPAAVLLCVVTHPEGLTRRHTLDMRAAIADAACLAAGTCDFTSYSVLGGGSRKVSRYIEGRGAIGGPRVQLQYNRPNLPLFSRGRFPFIGDYIDIAGPQYLSMPGGGWAWNTGRTADRPAPLFHVTWADNRNVGTPRDLNWERFTPAVTGPNQIVCVPGQVGIRNQDIYAAQLRPGLVVSAPYNSKRIAGLQRSFAVIARNTTDTEREYLFRILPSPGVIGSFDQFAGFGALDGSGAPLAPLTGIVVRIPRFSSATRTVFVALQDPLVDPDAAPDVLVPVVVDEVAPGTPTPTGISDFVYLNPDFENADFENPDFENAELHNPDFENINPLNPDFENPDFENFTLSTASSIRNPDFENPDFENPDFENPDFENPDFENPDFENPDFENPDFENPDFENPDFENPDFENPDFENGTFQVADTTWPVRNNGNTTSAYKANVFVNDPPAGVRYQLVVRTVFPSPAAVCAASSSASPPQVANSTSLVNIVGPDIQTNPFDRSFNDPSRDNATFHLAPGERGLVTLRAYCDEGHPHCTRDLMASLEGTVALGVVAQGANCVTCTGPGCSLSDYVGGFTECRIEDGPPRDIYDPIPPDVVVLDPTISTPETVVIASDGNNDGTEPVPFTVLATDNVAISDVSCEAGSTSVSLLSATMDGRFTFGGTFPLGPTPVTCTAFDVRDTPAPNQATVAFSVLVRDVTAPAFAEPAFTFSSAPTGTNGWYVTPAVTGVANVTDLSTVTVACADTANGTTVNGTSVTIAGDGLHGVTCTATDDSALSSSASAQVNIDSTPPAPPALAVSTPVGPNGWFQGPVTFSAIGSDVSGIASAACTDNGIPLAGADGAFTVTGDGTHVLSCVLTNGAGLVSPAATQTIRIDQTAPAITTPGTLVVEATSAAGATVAFDVTVVDLLGAATVACVPPGPAFPIGQTEVTCQAKDEAGNLSTASFTVTVRDTTPPVVTLNGAAVMSVQAGTSFVDPGASAVDTVSGVLPVIATGTVNTAVLGSYTRTYTATDAAGNTGSASRVVNVIDGTPPSSLAASVSPAFLWPPNGAIVNVTVTGTAVDDGVGMARIEWAVTDEYGLHQPSGSVNVPGNGAFSVQVPLLNDRRGNDKNGRVYAIGLKAVDAAGNARVLAQPLVVTVHDQSGK
jgi:hypothetical protein